MPRPVPPREGGPGLDAQSWCVLGSPCVEESCDCLGLWVLINCPLCSVGVSWANKRTANAPLSRLLGSDTHGSNPDPVLVADLQVPSELSQMLVLVLSAFGASLIF